MPLPAPLVSVAQMQALERAADAAGTSFATMMERAGAGVAAEISARNIALGQIASAYYFLHFLVILPLVSALERPLPLPNSISESVLHGEVEEAAPAGQTKRRGGSVATATAE